MALLIVQRMLPSPSSSQKMRARVLRIALKQNATEAVLSMQVASRSPKAVVVNPRGIDHSVAATAAASTTNTASPSFCERDMRHISVCVLLNPSEDYRRESPDYGSTLGPTADTAARTEAGRLHLNASDG